MCPKTGSRSTITLNRPQLGGEDVSGARSGQQSVTGSARCLYSTSSTVKKMFNYRKKPLLTRPKLIYSFLLYVQFFFKNIQLLVKNLKS